MPARSEHTFTFPDEARALLFVRRLCLVLVHPFAAFRNGQSVKVWDGSPTGTQVQEIIRLARMSGFVPSTE